jgi:hypothetical protein
VLSPTFTFIKQDFSDFDESENRKVLSWLTGTNKPGWIEIYKDDSNVVSYRLFGNFIDVEIYKLGSGRVVGYVATFESASPYAWSRKFIYPDNRLSDKEISNNDETNDYLTVSGTNSFKITCNTDEYNKLIYPKVIVNFDKNKGIYIPLNIVVNETMTNLPEYMIPNTIYVDNNEKLYINISSGDTKIRTDVYPISGDTKPSQTLLGLSPSNYFYDQSTRIIKRIESKEGSEVWGSSITKVGSAIRISSSYISDGQPITQDMELKNVAPGEEITLDGTNKVISVIRYDDDGNKINDVRVVGEDFNWNWLPLAHGENNITVTGNCDVQIQWIEPRKVGSL